MNKEFYRSFLLTEQLFFFRPQQQMRYLTNTGKFAVDSMASQTKVLKICHYSLDSTYLLLNSTVHNGTSHNYKHLWLALKHKSMAESINLLYLDEQTLQKGEIKKSFWTKKGIIISQSTLSHLKITMCMVFSRLHVVIQVYGKTFTQNHSLQEHKRQFLLKNREHKNTQKWHAQNVAKCYVYS